MTSSTPQPASASWPAEMAPRLVLGSTSPYRRALLARLRLPFEVMAPEVDEVPHHDELPPALARRLAREKARDVAGRCPDARVIGADQVADLAGHPIGKPGDHGSAVAQLRAMSGRMVVFHSAVAVVHQANDFLAERVSAVRVQFRALSEDEIQRYLLLDLPYDCAGSAKVETLGIALAERIESDDPTALEGLPLIHTCQLLREAGMDPLRWAR